MSPPVAANVYPLSLSLTTRVVRYLIAFRLFISIMLALAYFTGALVQGQTFENPAFATTTIVFYITLAVMLALESRNPATNFYYLANISIFVDILFQALLLNLFGGLDSGLGVLLIFSTAAAAVVLPLRNALLMASLTTLAIIGESVLGGLARFSEVDNLLRAGLYGFTTFITAILSHLLAYWIRDYRLIAEHQQRTLTRLEQINELIIRRMRSGVLAVDDRCNIKLINESAWFLLGSPPVSEQKLELVSPELNNALTAWRANPGAEMVPLTLAASQAQIVPKFVSLPGDRDIRVLIFLEDNDVVAQRAIELSANSLAKLSGSIAHEIRNPLAAVSHAAQLLEESELVPESEMRLVNIIHNQSRRMNGIVENILQLSRREKSRPEIFELTQWLVDLQEEFRSVHSSEEIELTFDIEEDEVLVLFDRSQLHQALWKLMENATEHAGSEDQHPRVSLEMKRKPKTGYCVITVGDNGPGVPENMISQIFEPFFTTRKQGSGLGLYIARQLCEANQAELTVDSTPGSGTRFHVRLALARSDAERNNIETR